ncbi:Lanosterol 14-alpha demethylase [Holothuria leucospilota]|uniref:Lanosterol 14-alpha demethylase n=1 Tax=Holothuria leucospilota TaxID=206669 RepID=A0A9Q0YRW4_HOLLE|nr:Lanosterol 14-alpha demethylase [Holothuria leucospilota]
MYYEDHSLLIYLVGFLTVIFILKTFLTGRWKISKEWKLPPRVPSSIPFLGSAIEFNKNPIAFLEKCANEYGDVFSFTMVGKTFTYLVGHEASAIFFNSKNDQLNAEEVYGKLMTPVIGDEVAFAVPNHIFLEQKKILKTGLNVAQFRVHVPLVEAETRDYFQRWGDRGEKDIYFAISELSIATVSHCLHGKEVRSYLDERMAHLYEELNGGISPSAWLLPSWVPLPWFIRRDRAHKAIKKIFAKAIGERKRAGSKDDFLQVLLKAKYKSGRQLNDNEVAGMLIGLLLGGHHTSSSTGAWLALFLAKHQDIQDRCYTEQITVCGKELPPITFDQLQKMELLDSCLRETLRLRPPIMTVMRMSKEPIKYKDLTIPPGHQVCVSLTVNQRVRQQWMPDPLEFKPERFLDGSADYSDKFSYVPFGGGRHRCIGENFAYMHLKTIFSVLLRKYKFHLINNNFPEVNYSSLIHSPVESLISYEPRNSIRVEENGKV